MQTYRTLLVVLGVVGALGTGEVVNAQGSLRMTRVPVAADDITSVTGADVYHFLVGVKSGEFDVVMSTQESPDADPKILSRHSFKGDEPHAIALLLSFLPRDKSPRGVLLSQEQEIIYHISCAGCTPPEIETVVPLPLDDVAGKYKTVLPMNSELSRKFSGKGEACLLAIVRSSPGEPVAMEKNYPLAKLSVVTADSATK